MTRVFPSITPTYRDRRDAPEDADADALELQDMYDDEEGDDAEDPREKARK
jgi:hypothetical protein